MEEISEDQICNKPHPPQKTNDPCPKCGENLTKCGDDRGGDFYCEKCGFVEDYGSP